MRVIRLLTVILLPLTALAQQPYLGTRISRVEIIGAPGEVIEQIPLRPDDIISPAAIRAAIQELYERGRYASIEVDATPEADGRTRLTFRVRPPYFFSTIRLEPANLLERPLSSYLSFPYGERFSRTELDRIVERISGQLQAEGYFQARIEPSYELDEETRLASVLITATAARRVQIRGSPVPGRRADFRSGGTSGFLRGSTGVFVLGGCARIGPRQHPIRVRRTGIPEHKSSGRHRPTMTKPIPSP